ncbi:MAG TPA: cation-translocating P-type ATPase [Clostridiales bacterium]|nr:cation-translocating P-type ATPase [Clostridiales bacterium]
MNEDTIKISDRNIENPMEGWDEVSDPVDGDLDELNDAIEKAMQEESKIDNDSFYGRPVPRGTNLRNRKIRTAPVQYAGNRLDDTPDTYTGRFEVPKKETPEPTAKFTATGAKEKTGTTQFRQINTDVVTIKQQSEGKGQTKRMKIEISHEPVREFVPEVNEYEEMPRRSFLDFFKADNSDEPLENFYEVTQFSDKNDVKFFFETEKQTKIFELIILAVLGIANFVITIFTKAGGGILGESSFTFPIVNFCLSLVYFAIIGKEIVKPGIKALSHKRFTIESSFTLVWFLNLFHGILGIAFSSAVGVKAWLYSMPCMVITFVFVIAQFLRLQKTDIGTKAFLGANSLNELDDIVEPELVKRIGGGIIGENEKICYFNKCIIPKDYVNKSLQDDPTNEISKPFFIGSVILGFVVFVICLIRGAGLLGAFSAFTAIITSCVPIGLFAVLVGLMLKSSISVSGKNSGIANFRSVDDFAQKKAVVLDVTDLYTSENCDITGMKVYNDFSPNTALQYAAALFMESKSPVGLVFEDFIESKLDGLPELTEYKYEDKLGVSAVIDGKFVILGTRAMLQSHNTEVIPQRIEDKLNDRGEKLFYLAVDEQLVAAFTVTYTRLLTIIKSVRKITKRGVTLLVRSTDPYLTAPFIENQLRLPANTIKILPNTAAETFKEINKPVATLDAKMFYGGNTASMFKLMLTALTLADMKKLIKYAANIVIVLFCLIISVFLISDTAAMTPFMMMFLQILRCVIIVAVTFLFNHILEIEK